MKLVRTLLFVLLTATLSGLGGVRDGQASRRLSVATTSAPHARPVAGREMLSPLTLHAAPPLVPQGGGGKTFSYVLGPLSASDSVAEFNRMGAQGYAFYIETTVGGGNYIYVKDSTQTGTYAYTARPQPATAADTLAQMNAMGAQGYSFYREIPISGGPGYLYVKDASHSGNFNYTIMPTPSTSSETLARMNAMGAQGYAYYMPTRFGDLYVKDSARAVTYSYAFGPFTSSFADTLAQMNGFGAQGYALLANFGFVSQNSFGNIYVKDSSRSGTYTFALAPFPASAAGGLQQLNAMGAAGAAYMTEYWVSPGGIHFVYMGFREGGACAYALSPGSQSFSATGGSATATVSAPSGCIWSAGSDVTWLKIDSGQNGSGNGTVGFSAAANNGATARTGAIVIGNQRLTVTQAAPAPTAGPCAAPGFADAVIFRLGTASSPSAIAVADYNGDGKPDLAVTDEINNSVWIRLGDGAGSFAPPVRFAVGDLPKWLVTADFNGDGKPDLATANHTSQNVSILLGNGSGGFTLAGNFPAGGSPTFLTSGDFTRDGKPDLAVTTVLGESISILVGNGAGGFSAPRFVPQFAAGTLAVGDFNRDGNLDLAATVIIKIAVWLGNGDGTFRAGSEIGVPDSSLFAAAADFNSDGKTDLAATAFTADKVNILLGNGSGGFGAAMSYRAGSYPKTLAVADINGDGKLDLATANQGGNNVSVLLGDGAGGFGSPINFNVGLGSSPDGIAAADFNGDGKMDLAAPVTNVSGGGVVILLNNCRGSGCTLSCTATAPASGTAGVPLSFTAAATLSGCAGMPVYDWDFGDNSPHSSQQNPTHTYASGGTYTWKLTTNLAGAASCVKTGVISIGAACPPPIIIAQPASPRPINIGQTATLSITAGGTMPPSYQWYQGQRGDTSRPVPGATASSFTTPPLSRTTSYWVRVSNACGDVHSAAATVTVIVLELTALEVTQGIQDLSNSVMLIQDKRTFVRAHVKSKQGVVENVTAKLVGTRVGPDNVRTPLGEQPPANKGQRIQASPDPKRISLDDSLYFELPREWLQGTVELAFRSLNHIFSPCDLSDDRCTIQVKFAPSPAPEIRFVGIVWEGNGKKYVPGAANFDYATRQIEAIFPIPRVIRGRQSNIQPVFFPVQPTSWLHFVRLNGMLATKRLLEGCVSPPAGACRSHYLGIVVPPSGELAGTLGRASGIPGDVAAGYIDDEFTIPHELAHSTGRRHTKTHDGDEPRPDRNYRPLDGTISQDKSDSGFFGFDLSGAASQADPRIMPPTTADLMSYQRLNWVSPYTYQGIREGLITRYGNPSLPATEAAGVSAPIVIGGQDAVIVSGSVSLLQGSGNIESVYVVEAAASAAGPPSGHYSLRFEDNQGRQLAAYSFEPDEPSEGTTGIFSLLLPWNVATAHLLLLKDGQVMDTRKVSARAPSVTVTYPNRGETLTGSTATLAWTASDPDGDNLKYAVQYSADGGSTWQTLAVDWPLTTYELDLNAVAGTNQGRVRVLASDGVLTAQDQSDANFAVPKHPPQVSIRVPENDRLYIGDQVIVLEGSGYDSEDGTLDDAALTWSSSLSGALGSGGSLSVKASMLAEGKHTLTLTAKDKDNETTASSVTIQVARTAPVLPAKLSVAPGALSLLAHVGTRPSVAQVIAVRNSGDGALNWAAQADQGWIRLGNLTGSSPSNLAVMADPTGLQVGQYAGKVIVSATGDGGTATIPVTLNVLPTQVTSVSAASYKLAPLAPESIVSAFGSNLAPAIAAATTLPLPISLASVEVHITDSAGVDRAAPLFYVSPTQINYQVPVGTATGAALVSVLRSGEVPVTETVQIAAVSPGLFAANADGREVAAGHVVRVKADNSQVFEPLAEFDPAQGRFVPRPIDLGPATDRIYLVLFGTGLRFNSGLAAVAAQVGGVGAEVQYAGQQPQFVGLDQVNLLLPRNLAGRGEVTVTLTIDGMAANPVKVHIK
jgi:uncharacterized protein (TIGR03437 family)